MSPSVILLILKVIEWRLVDGMGDMLDNMQIYSSSLLRVIVFFEIEKHSKYLLVWSTQNGNVITAGLDFFMVKGSAPSDMSLPMGLLVRRADVFAFEIVSNKFYYTLYTNSFGFLRSFGFFTSFISFVGRVGFFSTAFIFLIIFSSCDSRFSSSPVWLKSSQTFFSNISSLDICFTSIGIIISFNLPIAITTIIMILSVMAILMASHLSIYSQISPTLSKRLIQDLGSVALVSVASNRKLSMGLRATILSEVGYLMRVRLQDFICLVILCICYYIMMIIPPLLISFLRCIIYTIIDEREKIGIIIIILSPISQIQLMIFAESMEVIICTLMIILSYYL